MSDMAMRYAAIKDRINLAENRIKQNLTPEEKIALLNELVQLCSSLGRIAIEKMEKNNG